MGTLSGEATLYFHLPPISLVVLIRKGLHCPGEQTGSHNSCFPLKNVTENHGGALIRLKGFLK